MLDIPDLKVKTGHLAPLHAPAPGDRRPGARAHAAAPRSTRRAGLDVVCHAAESYISKPFDARPRPESPDDRPPYQGANPVADVWSAKALEYGGPTCAAPSPTPTTSRRAAR